MAFARRDVIGGIQIDPAERRGIDAEPGVAGIGTQQARLARRRLCQQVAGDIACGQADGAHGGDGDMGQVLADTGADLEHLVHRRRGVGDSGVVAELLVDAAHQFDRAFQ